VVARSKQNAQVDRGADAGRRVAVPGRHVDDRADHHHDVLGKLAVEHAARPQNAYFCSINLPDSGRLVGSVCSRADQEICQQFGNSTGVSRHGASVAGCGNGGQRTSSLKAAATDAKQKKRQSDRACNYAGDQ
jgi:hypothetical protein